MSNITIDESGMWFDLNKERVFLPEKEDFYQKLSSEAKEGEGISICDIVLLQPSDCLLLIEAKTSAPKDIRQFVQEIKKKFADSMLIYMLSWANRENTQANNLPPLLKTPDALQRKIRFVLIIKNYEKEWLVSLQNSLSRECRSLEKLFSLEETVVYNPDLARRKLGITINE